MSTGGMRRRGPSGRRRVVGALGLWLWLGGALVGCTEPNPYLPAAGSGTTGAPSEPDGGQPSEDGPGTGSGSLPAECASRGMECVEGPAPGWQGPFAWVEREADAAPAPCAAPWDVELVEAYSEVAAPAPDCACDCGPADGATCSGFAFLARFEDDAECGRQDEEIIVANPCVAVPSGSWPDTGSFLFTPPAVVGGECEPVDRSEIAAAAFVRRHQACGAQLDAADCGPGRWCASPPADPFYSRLCVWREGESECPAAGPYTDRVTLFRALDDGRGCTACSCAPPRGACEGSTMSLTLDVDCRLPSDVSPEPGVCTAAAATGEAIRGLAYDPGAPPSGCEPSASAPVGAAQGADAVTFCCTP